MSAVFAKCTRIGEKYYVSPDCVLNFDSLLAYPRSAVLCVEPHEHSRRSRPGIRITYGPDLFDYMYFSSFESRDRALADFAHAAHPF